MKRRLMLAGGVEVDQACRYCTAFMAMSPDSTGQERGECHLPFSIGDFAGSW